MALGGNHAGTHGLRLGLVLELLRVVASQPMAIEQTQPANRPVANDQLATRAVPAARDATIGAAPLIQR